MDRDGRAGAVMVPVNTAYTPWELSFVLNDSDAQFLIMDEEFQSVLDEVPERPEMLVPGHVLVRGKARSGEPDLEQLIADGVSPFEAPVPAEASDLLNIQYTSGTTGFPKGCMLTHEYWIQPRYNLAFTRAGDERHSAPGHGRPPSGLHARGR